MVAGQLVFRESPLRRIAGIADDAPSIVFERGPTIDRPTTQAAQPRPVSAADASAIGPAF